MPSTLMLLSNPYRPDPRVLIEARALILEGIDVNLVAWDREQTWPKRATEDGIQVLRLGPKCPPREAAKILLRLPRFWLGALKARKRINFDVVHSHDFDTLPLGRLISRLSGKPLLYDAHELYAKMVQNEVGPIWRLIWWLEKICASQTDSTITVSDELAAELPTSRSGKATVVSTTQDPSVIGGSDVGEIRRKYGLDGFVVSYLGSLEPGRFVEETISAFVPEDGLTVLVAGSGTLAGKVEETARSSKVVKYIGVVPPDEALRLTLASDLVVAMMDPGNLNNVVGTPGKIINAMAVGRPLITTRGLNIATKVEDAGCGLVVPWSKADFRGAVIKARANRASTAEMGIKGKAYYDQHFSWNRSREGLLKAYRALIPPS
ncbi:MAG: hypothetical protein A3K76_06645 [Euryarchaeota archaeon RBG_13_57_23]|nr:MAG: hypothetical protein A3K76_06645 [Euryarchaeota archaeon RBG_13_57_23]